MQAAYPAAALKERVAAEVELLVMIAVDGTVLEAQVVKPAGHGFDEAALDAVRRFVFEPARRNGQAVASRIRYRYVFTPPKPPPATGLISGTILSASDGLPMMGVHGTIVARDSTELRPFVTDAQGQFELSGLREDTYRIEVASPGFSALSLEETVHAGEKVKVTYRMVSESDPSDQQKDLFSAHAVVAAPTREVTRRTIEREMMMRLPGTTNDAIRSVEALPGVSRPPFGAGLLIVRGSSPTDTQTTLDGVPLPQLYHFGGLRSVYSGHMLRRISLYSGNFSSRFGRRSGGIFELETRDPQTDDIHGVVDLSPIDGSVLLEGPLTDKLSAAGSFRRSMFDLALRVLSAGNDSGFTVVPNYYDYQLMLSYRASVRDRIRFQFYGSSDRLGLLNTNQNEANASVAENAIDVASRFNLFQVSWKRKLTERAEQYMTLQAGPTVTDVGAGRDKVELRNLQIYGRGEWLLRMYDNLRLVTGIDVNTGTYSAEYVGPSIGQADGNATEEGAGRVGASAEGLVLQPGVYVDLGIDIGPVTLNGAVRGDYYHEIREYSIDPRLVLAYHLSPEWTAKLGAGVYSQPPQLQESNKTVGNPDLEPLHTSHYSTAVYWAPSAGVELGLEGFYKQIWNNIVSGEGENAPAYTNEGIGRVLGMEASAHVQPTGFPFSGIVSYTLLRSERKDHPDERWRKFDFDQTHGLTVALMYILPRGWEVGAAGRYYTGNPYTPVVGRVFNATERKYDLLSGAVNSARNPSYKRLDLRVQKTWQATHHTTTLYLDVQNALVTRNQEAFFYNFDGTRRGVVYGLPIIPAIGVRGQF